MRIPSRRCAPIALLALALLGGLAPRALAADPPVVAPPAPGAPPAPPPRDPIPEMTVPPVVVHPPEVGPSGRGFADPGTAGEGLTALGLGQGPEVPLRYGGSRDVLSPRRVFEATPTSVEEIARRLPGVSSRLYSGDEWARPSISMRGMPDNGFTEYTSVLVDGMNMSTMPYGWTAISIFPFSPERIWAAETIRGAHALRYGPNTIGGIVNFLSMPIPEEWTVLERVVYGSYSYLSTTSMVGGTDARSGFGFLGTFVAKSGDTWRKESEFNQVEGSVKTHTPLDGCSWLDVNGYYWNDHHQLPSRLTKAQYDADRRQNVNPREIDWNGWSSGVDARYHRDFNACAWVEAYTWYRRSHRELESARPPAGPPFTTVRNSDSDMSIFALGVDGEFAARIGVPNTFHWTVRYMREAIDRWQFDEPLGGGARTYLQDAYTKSDAIAASLDDTVTFGRFTANAGLRMEWIADSHSHDLVTGGEKDYDFFNLFPGVSLTYAPTCETAFFANYHQSCRAPQVFSYDFNRPDQELDFETGQNAEVGFRVVDWRGLTGSTSLWYVDFSDFIEQDPVLLVVTNYGGFESYGVDLALEYDFGRCSRALRGLSVFGNATWQHSEFTNGVNKGQETQFVPEWIYDAGVRYEHRSGLYGVFEAMYHDDSWVTPANDFKTPGYLVCDLRGGWRKTFCFGCAEAQLDLSLTCKNVFDRETYIWHTTTQLVGGAPREFYGELALGIKW